MSGRLAGKVALISGAAQGMGAAHARAFVAEGAKVIITDIVEGLGKSLSNDLGPDTMFIHHDVTKAADWSRVVSEGESNFGPINVLVNNAGVLGEIASTIEMTQDAYERCIAVNQTGVFLGMQSILPSMVRNGGGSIINISSIGGNIAVVGISGIAYMASKFAVRGMTVWVANEHGGDNIRVNSIHPGYIKTQMMAAGTDENGGGIAAHIPLGRMAEPEEVSNLAVFLASDESSFITGAQHVIDGGMIAVSGRRENFRVSTA